MYYNIEYIIMYYNIEYRTSVALKLVFDGLDFTCVFAFAVLRK